MLWRPHELTQPLVHRPSAGPECQARKGLAGKPASVKGPAQEIRPEPGQLAVMVTEITATADRVLADDPALHFMLLYFFYLYFFCFLKK